MYVNNPSYLSCTMNKKEKKNVLIVFLEKYISTSFKI